MTLTQHQALNRYGRLCAEVYDLDKPIGSLFDTAYYTARLKDLDGPVLEAGAGTGRLMIPLMQAGIDIEGFDSSADMLDICRTRAAERGLLPRLTQARMQDFVFDRTFAAIIVPASTFILVDDFDEALAVLRRFRAHLAAGGLLLLDVPPLDFFEAPAGERSWTAQNGDLITLRSSRAETDVIGQRRVNHDRYERWREGRLVETEIERFAYRVWGMRELAYALAQAGFGKVEIGADYRPGRAPGPGGRVLNFAAST